MELNEREMMFLNLSTNIKELEQKVDGINQWIENNLDTDPNFYEMVSCRVDYGRLVREFYSNFSHQDPYNIRYNSVFNELTKKIHHMEDLRGTSFRSGHPFFQDKNVRKFWGELCHRTDCAQYFISENEQYTELNKEVLCKVAGIYLYIWQEKQKNPEYRYDNVEEFEWLNSSLEILEEDPVCRLYDNDGMIQAINESYLYNKDNELKPMGK